MSAKSWSESDFIILKDMYENGASYKEISKKLQRTVSSVSSKVCASGFVRKAILKNNHDYKATYQNYDWCYDRFINKGMSHREMAKECGASLRVIQKWCAEIYKLNAITFKDIKHLNDIQRQIIMFGTIGDGHIDARENDLIYIESHAENQKDYLFWKWSFLKDICIGEPVYYEGDECVFSNGKYYRRQPSYRMSTRIVNDMKEIRSMSIHDVLCHLNDLGLSLHMLDDGYRGKSSRNVCVAGWSNEDIAFYMKQCNDLFGIHGHQNKDLRYVHFDISESKIIDDIILKNIPNDLDIVKYKILEKYKRKSA